MGQLSIKFTYMFLLVQRQDKGGTGAGPVVLLPSGGAEYPHQLSIRFGNDMRNGGDVSFAATNPDGSTTPLINAGRSSWPHANATGGLILSLEAIATAEGGSGRVQRKYVDDALARLADVSARFVLPNGAFTANAPGNISGAVEDPSEIQWTIAGREGRLDIASIYLTDSMTFTCPLADGVHYALLIDGKPQTLVRDDKTTTGNICLTVINGDPPGTSPANPYSLDDFAVLYSLAIGPSDDWNPPVKSGSENVQRLLGRLRPLLARPGGTNNSTSQLARQAHRSSNLQPICGALQGCLPDEGGG